MKTKVKVKILKLRRRVRIVSDILIAASLTVLYFAEDGAIVDETETNLVALRRTIYLTVQSSLDHNECAHKMMKMQLKPGQEIELCHMILDCCAQQRTYEKFFGLLAQVRNLLLTVERLHRLIVLSCFRGFVRSTRST